MERNKEQLSSKSWVQEYQEWMEARGIDESMISDLHPSLPDDYFEKHPEIRLGPEIKEVSKIRPFIRRRDLNNNPELYEDNRPRHAWEIGIEVDF